MLKKFLVLSFLEGAAVMAAELCGAKLLAPIYGSSLDVWASVMGITLAALALGYFFGGSLSGGKKNIPATLFRLLVIAALFVLLMPVLSHYLVPRISYFAFLPAVMMSSLLLLFPPVFFLGATSPLFIALQADAAGSGKASGTVYAVSTFGGIFATFLCGFYLIPQIGLNACLLGFGGALLVATLLVFRSYTSPVLFLFAGLVYLNLQFGLKKTDQLFVSDSLLGHLEIEEFVNGKQDSVRVLKINGIIQTEMSLATHKSVSDYVRLIDTLVPFRTQPGEALLLGLGGGLTANLLKEKNYRVARVELDRRIAQMAHRYFYLKGGCTYVGDARYFMNDCKKKYDLVLVDIFKAEEQPSHVLTYESLQRLKDNLSSQGRILVNWHGYVHGKRGLGTSILYNTFLSSGFHVALCSISPNEGYRNIIFVAAINEPGPLPFQINEKLTATTLINTDDKPLLEAYNAEANKDWRTSYLRYYQRR